MSHNFRKTGHAYVSKANRGNGSSPDLASNDLVATLQTVGLDQTLVIGAGLYQAQLGTAIQVLPASWVADGRVIFRAPAPGLSWSVPYRDGGRYDFTGFRWEGWQTILNPGGDGNRRAYYTNCEFLDSDVTFYSYSSGVTHRHSLFINSSATFRDASNYVEHSILYSGSFAVAPGRRLYLTYSHLGPAAPLALADLSQLADIAYCNLEGPLYVAGQPMSFADALANGLPASNISQPARYNSPETEDFTLQAGSPHLALNIGPDRYRFSNSVLLEGPAGAVTAGSGHYFREVATGTQIPIIAAENVTATVQAGRLRLKVQETLGGQLKGWFRLAPMQVDVVAKKLTRINFAAGLNYDTDYPVTEAQLDANSPNPYNNNVPNSHNYASGDAGRNPNRMEVPMRWSTKDLPLDAVATDWVTGTDFALFEWGENCQYNPVTGIGNGSPDFLRADQTSLLNAPQAPIATWVQFEVVLDNGYYSR